MNFNIEIKKKLIPLGYIPQVNVLLDANTLATNKTAINKVLIVLFMVSLEIKT